jgi:hypothetical protein
MVNDYPLTQTKWIDVFGIEIRTSESAQNA